MYLSPFTFLLLPTILLGPACSGQDKASPDDTGNAPDTDSPAGDSDSTDTPEPRYGDVSGRLSIPEGVTEVASLKVGLLRIEYGDGPDLRGTVAVTGALVSGTSLDYTLSLQERPPQEDLIELEPHHAPGMVGALYIPLAFVDQDDNGAFVSGERVVGGSLSRLAVWLEGTLPEGVEPGWSIVDTGLSGIYETGNCLLDTTNPLYWRHDFDKDYPAFYDLTEPVDVSLQGLLASVVVGGVTVGLPEGSAVALLPYQVVYQGKALQTFPALGDLPLDAGGSFSLPLEDEPPLTLDVSPDTAWDYALGFAVPYMDTDKDGQYSSKEANSDASLCSGNSLAAVRYTWPIETYRGWRLMECYGVTAGWRVVTRESDGTWVHLRSNEESADLRIDEATCSR